MHPAKLAAVLFMSVSAGVACGGVVDAPPGDESLDADTPEDDASVSEVATDPAAAVSCVTPTMACPSVATLLAEREGYARDATGGLGGTFVVVTSSADNPDGTPVAGGGVTLRDAVTKAKGPVWITFASDMAIRLSPYRPILVPSNVTVDGRGHHVVLYQNGFQLQRSSNVIITSLTINGQACSGTSCTSVVNPDGTLFSNPTDGIRLVWGARRVWMDHLDISNIPASGKPIAITEGSTDITISWTVVRSSLFGVLIYDLQSADGTMSNSGAPPRVTIEHSMLASVVQRNPRVSSSEVHFYNNVVYSWDYYAMSFGGLGYGVVEGNLFMNNQRRQCDHTLYKETSSPPLTPGSPNSCVVPSDPTKAVYCAEYCSSLPWSSGSIFVNQDYYYMSATANGNGYYHLYDNDFVIDGAVESGVNGYRGDPAFLDDRIFFDSSYFFTPDYCYQYESGAQVMSRANASIATINSSSGAYDNVFPSASDTAVPAPVAGLMPGAGNQPRRVVPTLRCPAVNVSVGYAGTVPVVSQPVDQWPYAVSFREDTTAPYHQANIYSAMPSTIAQSRPAYWNLRFQVKAVGARDLNFYLLDTDRQSAVYGRLIVDLASGSVTANLTAGALTLGNVKVAQLSSGDYQVIALVSIPGATTKLRLSFASMLRPAAGGTGYFVGNTAAGLDIKNVRLEPSTLTSLAGN